MTVRCPFPMLTAHYSADDYKLWNDMHIPRPQSSPAASTLEIFTPGRQRPEET